MNGSSVPARRPAETGAAASALALLVTRALGVQDVDIVTALAIVIGFVPAGITWWVDNGSISLSARRTRKRNEKRSK